MELIILLYSGVSAMEVDALFQAMDLVVGRIGYLVSLGSNNISHINFEVGHYILVEIASMQLDDKVPDAAFQTHVN